ncbi:MAG: putative tRNA (cytidine(34)-2'-O)-methyltransferase [Candidatus Sericytochromatia bacterium]|nr:MAG: putative tRNA (cytidine(34)-2'-O)-methyltransferase [Candidatus Sericytochromatia bacterium]
MMKFNIVLVYPQIPQNTGNIARLCAVTNSKLHLVEPMGFHITDKLLKRAGLDYWDFLDIERHSSLKTFFEKYSNKRMIFLSSKVKKIYYNYKFQNGDFLIFGSETSGLPQEVHEKYSENFYTIPQFNENVRCLNLSNSVSIVLYEAIRQVMYN